MATAKLRVVRPEDGTSVPGDGPGAELHRIQQVREQQGVSLRTCARRMKLDMKSLRAQEQPSSDLKLSQLRHWQKALDVPMAELIEDGDLSLSRPIMERARLVRLMKTVVTLREQAPTPETERLAQVLVEQLIEIMPELAEVSPWHSVGQRRTLDEVGRIAEHPISTSVLSANLMGMQDD